MSYLLFLATLQVEDQPENTPLVIDLKDTPLVDVPIGQVKVVIKSDDGLTLDEVPVLKICEHPGL